MYIAMNRFSINRGRELEFEEIWRNRETFLDTVPGFIQFSLLRGAEGEKTTTFISHSLWKSETDFLAWTKSEAFQKAHRDAKTPEGILAGPPQFEGYITVAMEQAQ